MLTNIWSWLAALGVGACSAALAWVTGHTGTPGGIDPMVAGLLVGVVTKLVTWLTTKIPKGPNQAALQAERLVSWQQVANK